MKRRINENTKITLTIGQIKRLIKESTSDEIVWDENLIFTPDMIDDLVSSGKVSLDCPKLKNVADKIFNGDLFNFFLKLDMKPANVKSKYFAVYVSVDTKLKPTYKHTDRNEMANGWTVQIANQSNPDVSIPDYTDYDNYALPLTNKTKKSLLNALAHSTKFMDWMDEQCFKGSSVKLSALWDYGHFVCSKDVDSSVRETYKFLFDAFFDALEKDPKPSDRPEIPTAQDVERKKEKDRKDHEDYIEWKNKTLDDYYADAARTGRYTGD